MLFMRFGYTLKFKKIKLFYQFHVFIHNYVKTNYPASQLKS